MQAKEKQNKGAAHKRSSTMPKKVKQLPEEFKTLEDAAEFWDTHDSTEFTEVLEEVDVKVDLQKRHYLIELDKNTALQMLKKPVNWGIEDSSENIDQYLYGENQ